MEKPILSKKPGFSRPSTRERAKNRFLQLLSNMIFQSEQLTIGFVNDEFEDLLPIEEVEISPINLGAGRILQMSRFNAFFRLQILLEINTMSIKFNISISLAVLVHFNELFKSVLIMHDAINQYE
jgi:hypothetical protein